jgi:hypothetical protein
MKAIKVRFEKIQERNPFWSSFICFSETISGKNFKPETISRHFQKLVDKDDYSRSDKKEILGQLCTLSECVEDNRNQH